MTHFNKSTSDKIKMKISVMIASLLVLFSIEMSAQTAYQPVIKFNSDRDPAADLKDAVTEAQKSDKNIILDVGGDWCVWCHRIDAFIESHEDINNFLRKNYVVMKVNYSPENKNESFLSNYPKIPGYPHFFVLNKDGKLLHSQDTGKLEEGKDYNLKKFMSFLEVWAPNKN
jgi:thioredoxin-related protein